MLYTYNHAEVSLLIQSCRRMWQLHTGTLWPHATTFLLYTTLSLSCSLFLCCSCCLFPLHTYVHTCTRTHNSCSKFFQGISRLINRLVVWGSSEVQRSRLNPLTGRIISGRWVHTSPIAPYKTLPSWLDLWQNKHPLPPTIPPLLHRLPMLLTLATVSAPERQRDGMRGGRK